MNIAINQKKLRVSSLDRMASTGLLFFSLFVYPFINRVYDGQSGMVVTVNKFVWSFLVPCAAVYLLRRQINRADLVDKLFILVAIYLTFSLLVFSIQGQISLTGLLKEISYSILPIAFFFIYKKNLAISSTQTYTLIVLICSAVIVIGLWSMLDIPKPKIIEQVKNVKSLNFQSFYSPIVLASMAPICMGALIFGMTNLKGLFKLFLILLLMVASIMTLQRAVAVGFVICLLLYSIKNIYSVRFYLSLGLFIVLAAALVFGFGQVYLDLSIFDMIVMEWKGLNLEQVLYERRHQSFIFNVNHPLSIMFGEGFGKYSPQNDLSPLIMPDASYLRLYNELGIIGSILFFSPFILLAYQSFKKGHLFNVFLIAFVLVHFYFNRVLMSLPTAYFIYAMLGLGSKRC